MEVTGPPNRRPVLPSSRYGRGGTAVEVVLGGDKGGKSRRGVTTTKVGVAGWQAL